MKLRVINTGSAGNCYLFEAKDSTLIVELGLRFKDIKQALGFNLDKVCGALITHEHGDHAKGIKEAIAAGVNVYASRGTIAATDLQSHRLHKLYAKGTYTIGGFKIIPFDVKHDAAEPFGYLINHEECGNVVFLTDSLYAPYKFPNTNHFIVEANYCEDIVNERLEKEKLNGFVRDRTIQNHMSLQTCKQLLQANDLSQVQNIVLIHLSDGNSDAARFKKEVQQITGKPVHIAEKGMTINLNKTPF